MSTIMKIQSAMFRLTRPFTYVFGSRGVEKVLFKPRNIVLTRLEDVGDMLVFVPTLKTFRRGYPNAKITLVTRSKTGHEVINGCPYVDKIIHVKDSFYGKFKFIRSLRKIKPDIFVVSAQEFGKVKWGLWGKAKVIVGYREAKSYNEFRKIKLAGIVQVFPAWDNSLNEVEKNLKFASSVGISSIYRELEYTWPTTMESRFSNILIRSLNISVRDFVVILLPFSKREAKEWTPEKFAYLADWIIENLNAKLIINGAPNEHSKIASIRKLMKNKCFDIAGKVSLRQLPTLIKNCDLAIGVDSGPIHFAAALKIPYVALFRPIEHEKWAHAYSPSIQKNIYKTPSCMPCADYCKNRTCMDAIGLEDVMEAIRDMGNAGTFGKEIKEAVKTKLIRKQYK